MTTRRQFCAALAAVGFAARAGRAGASEEIVVTDMAGRLVRLPARPKRIVLLEAHDLLTMSLLHPEPASLTVGWAAVDRIDSALLTGRLQKGRAIEVVGKLTPETISLEGLIGLQPDLVVTTAFMSATGAQDSLLSRLEQLGVPVVFSDASSNAAVADTDVVAKLTAQMRMWGGLLGASDKAEAYIRFFKTQLAEIGGRLSGSEPVATYLEVQSTTDDCCWAAGVKVWGELLALAGGRPLPGVTAPWFEKLSLEYVISTPHEVYIASGGDYSAGGRPTIAPGVDRAAAQQSLERLLTARPAFEAASSVRAGRVYGVWTGLISNLPLNILFVAAAAKWLHPDRCAGIDPSDMLNVINRDFAAVPIEGSLWASIGPKD